MPDTAAEAASDRALTQPVLDTARLRLRPLAPEDVPAITELAGDIAVSRWTSAIPHPLEPRLSEAWILASEQERQQGVALTWGVERLSDGAFVGAFSLRIDHAAGPDDDLADGSPAYPALSGDIGYWIGQPYWNQGYASEALARLVRFAFEGLDLELLTGSALVENAASIAVLAKAGLQDAGTTVAEFADRTEPVQVMRLHRDAYLASRPPFRMVLVSAVVLVDHDGRVLLAERPAGKPMAGFWEFPGGKVQAGETPEAALIRELKEELGIDVAASCLAPFTFASHAYDDFHLLMPLFVCRVWKGTPQPLEGQRLVWARIGEIDKYPLPPADKPLVAMLRDLL